jgi:hypothetical protein
MNTCHWPKGERERRKRETKHPRHSALDVIKTLQDHLLRGLSLSRAVGTGLQLMERAHVA